MNFVVSYDRSTLINLDRVDAITIMYKSAICPLKHVNEAAKEEAQGKNDQVFQIVAEVSGVMGTKPIVIMQAGAMEIMISFGWIMSRVGIDTDSIKSIDQELGNDGE